MLCLTCATIASGLVQESRVQEHSRSPGGDQEGMGRGLWMSEGTEKQDCKSDLVN